MSRADLRAHSPGERGAARCRRGRRTVDQAEPRAVGHWLVDNHFIDPISLDHTLTVLGEHLPATPERLAAVLAAVFAGYGEALHDHTRVEQAHISSAVFAAHVAAAEVRWSSEARFGATFADAAIGIVILSSEGEIHDETRGRAGRTGGRRGGHPARLPRRTRRALGRGA